MRAKSVNKTVYFRVDIFNLLVAIMKKRNITSFSEMIRVLIEEANEKAKN